MILWCVSIGWCEIVDRLRRWISMLISTASVRARSSSERECWPTSRKSATWSWLRSSPSSRLTRAAASLAGIKQHRIVRRIYSVFGSVGNVVGRINEDNQRRARLVLGWVTVFKMGKPTSYVTSNPGQLSLAIPTRLGKMSTGDDYGHRQGRNGEFCVTVGPVTRTADILTQSVIWRTWAVC